MAKKSVKKIRVQRVSRLENRSEEQITKQWRAVTPRFIKWAIYLAWVTVILFGYNHLFKPNQQITNICNVAFQICLAFLACFAVLITMGLIFGRETHGARK